MTQMRRAPAGIMLLIIAIELMICSYLCYSIVFVSTDHTMHRTALSLSSCISKCYYDPDDAAVEGKKKYEEEQKRIEEEKNRWKGPVLSAGKGVVYGPSGKETYYNLNMTGVVSIMRGIGNEDEYWVRDDGCKMLGDYIMVAANLKLRPRGSIVEPSLGKGIVCDTGGFARKNPTQIDIATTW